MCLVALVLLNPSLRSIFLCVLCALCERHDKMLISQRAQRTASYLRDLFDKSIHSADYSVLDPRLAKIQQEAELHAGEAQIGEQLLLMHVLERSNALDLYDHFAVDNDICPETLIKPPESISGKTALDFASIMIKTAFSSKYQRPWRAAFLPTDSPDESII
jgi:hypothetical protein